MFNPSKSVHSVSIKLFSRVLQEAIPHMAQWEPRAIGSHLVGQAPLAAMPFAAEIFFAEL